MAKLSLHWTEQKISAFVHRLSFDFITQLHKKLQKARISNKEFGIRLKVTPGRVSQILNAPGNITLESAVEYARGLGMKVALVAYDDNDPENTHGPINSEVFYQCWKLQGAPQDVLDLSAPSTVQTMFDFVPYERTSVNEEFRDVPLPFVTREFATAFADTNTNRIGMVQ
jgi:hypothetical protein